MHDLLKATKKTKISLPDYDFQGDIRNRLLLKKLNTKTRAVLEEILCNSLQFSIESLAENLDLPIDELYVLLESLAQLDLFNFDGHKITVDKDKRKYFETQLTRFEEDFVPNLDFFQNLLKCLPIEVLPIWYHVPRTSNNIFQSLVEKHLLTPQIYQRYLSDFISGTDLSSRIAKELFCHPELSIETSSLISKYDLSSEEFEEIVLQLELNIVAFLSFNEGHEVLTPFYEWREYQKFLKQNAILPVLGDVLPNYKNEYSFIQEMTDLALLAESTKLPLFYHREIDSWALTPPAQTLVEAHTSLNKYHTTRVLNKLLVLGLGAIEESHLVPTKAAKEWASIPIMQRAHVTFKHPHNLLSIKKNPNLATQRTIIEIQKSLSLINSLGWVYLENFLKVALIPLSEEKQVSLKKIGRSWFYAPPQYSATEKEFIEYILLEWLFESGVVQPGSHNGKTCIRLTTLGKSLLRD